MATIPSIINLPFTCLIEAPVFANTFKIPITIFFFTSAVIDIFDGFVSKMNKKKIMRLLFCVVVTLFV